MLIKPKCEEKLGDNYIFGVKTKCQANELLCKPIFKEFWHGFCANSGDIEFSSTKDFVFKVGNVKTLFVPQSGFVLEVTKEGISLTASDDKNLIYGFFALLERIRPICTKKGEERFSIECCNVCDYGKIKVRMLHLCVFPETPLNFLKKILRTAAFLRYTHVIIEFWGTLEFDCLKELSWKEAFTKEQVKPILNEAKELGLELVPMFNHWGHAAGSSISVGKHVVLDQNLSLTPLFSNSGWEWNIANPEVVKLQDEIRSELIDLFGDGEYFHIGCDEAFSAKTKEDFIAVVEYINSVVEKLEKHGRKAIMWGDMLLHKDVLDLNAGNNYYLFSPSKEIQEIFINKLTRSVIIADWQYNAVNYPLETSLFFKENGFEVLACPWDRSDENIKIISETVKNNDLLGVIHTTWNTLESQNGARRMASAAAAYWQEDSEVVSLEWARVELSAVMRKIDFPNGDYINSGWKRKFL